MREPFGGPELSQINVNPPVPQEREPITAEQQLIGRLKAKLDPRRWSVIQQGDTVQLLGEVAFSKNCRERLQEAQDLLASLPEVAAIDRMPLDEESYAIKAELREPIGSVDSIEAHVNKDIS